MKKLITTVALTTILGLSSLYSHGGANHNHDVPVKREINKTSVKQLAKQEVKRLALAKKIDKSWLMIEISKMKKTKFNYSNEWVVSFKNSAIKDASKQTLYVFVSVYGELKGANYTGK